MDFVDLAPISGVPKIGEIVFIDWITEKGWSGEIVNTPKNMKLAADSVAVKIDHRKEIWSFKIVDLKVDNLGK